MLLEAAHTMRTACSALILAMSVVPAHASASDESQSRNQLIAQFRSEGLLGVGVLYTQQFKNARHQIVRLSGSLYGVVTLLSVQGCALKLGMTFQDRYAGSVGHTSVSETKSTFNTTFDFVLTPEVAESLSTVMGIPVQLSNGPRTVCSERSTCNLDWVRVQSRNAHFIR